MKATEVAALQYVPAGITLLFLLEIWGKSPHQNTRLIEEIIIKATIRIIVDGQLLVNKAITVEKAKNGQVNTGA